MLDNEVEKIVGTARRSPSGSRVNVKSNQQNVKDMMYRG